MKKNKRIKSLTRVKGKYAYLFILPFLFGFIFMFAVPMAQSAWFSLCKVGINRNGFVTAFNGIGNYKDALLSDVFFRQRVVESVLNMLLNVPLILVFSFFMANVLNSSFPGRSVARVIMFMTLVLASSALISFDNGDVLQSAMGSSSFKASESLSGLRSYNLGDWLVTSGILPTKFSNYLMSAADRIYSIVIYSGVEILIFLAALQSVPHDLYEVASIEGASAWECYWKITFPLVTPQLLLCAIYSIIDSFTMSDNTTLSMIQDYAFIQQAFGISSAMSWIYFAIIILIIAAVYFLLSRLVKRYES